MHNLILLNKTGTGDWQKLSDNALVCSGILFASGTMEVRFAGGDSVGLLSNISYPFQSVDLSQIEFKGTPGTLRVFAGSR